MTWPGAFVIVAGMIAFAAVIWAMVWSEVQSIRSIERVTKAAVDAELEAVRLTAEKVPPPLPAQDAAE